MSLRVLLTPAQRAAVEVYADAPELYPAIAAGFDGRRIEATEAVRAELVDASNAEDGAAAAARRPGRHDIERMHTAMSTALSNASAAVADAMAKAGLPFQPCAHDWPDGEFPVRCKRCGAVEC